MAYESYVLPQWLEEYLKNRGLMGSGESPSSLSPSSPVTNNILRKRILTNWGDDDIASYVDASPYRETADEGLFSFLFGKEGDDQKEGNTSVLQSLKDEINKEVDEFTSFVNDPVGSIVDGAKNIVTDIKDEVNDVFNKISSGDVRGLLFPGPRDELTPLNAGLIGMASRSLGDPTLSTDRKIGAGLGMLGAGLMGTIGGPISLLGSILNSLGAHHDFNPSKDSNLEYDASSGRIQWSSLDPGAGGWQYGPLNNENMMSDIAANNPNTSVTITAPDGTKYNSTASALNEIGMTQLDALLDEQSYRPLDFMYMAPNPDITDHGRSLFDLNVARGPAFEHTVPDFMNETIEQGLGQYNYDGTGGIRNAADAAARAVNKSAGETVIGYTGITDIADAIAETMSDHTAMGITDETFQSAAEALARDGNLDTWKGDIHSWFDAPDAPDAPAAPDGDDEGSGDDDDGNWDGSSFGSYW